jgi:tetratricopeptide repeat protein 8
MEAQLDPLYHAHSRFRRRDFDGCIELCTKLLEKNPYDQAVWFLKCRALTEKSYIDDSDWDEEGIAEVLLDDNAIAQAPRPGTSLNRPATTARLGTSLALNRPMTSSGRPITGFARPGTSSVRPPTSAAGGLNRDAVATAFRGQRPGTSRAMTALGRAVRIGTASMLSTPGGPFINSDKLDMKRYGSRPALAKALWEYLWYVEANPRKAMELSAAATQAAFFNDWWWKQKLGKCYYALGMTRDAEQQFKSSLRAQEHVSTYLELSKLYQNKLDQPTAAHGE